MKVGTKLEPCGAIRAGVFIAILISEHELRVALGSEIIFTKFDLRNLSVPEL